MEVFHDSHIFRRRDGLVITASTAFAQSAPSRVWLDIDFVSVRPSQDTQTFTYRTQVFDELASFASASNPLNGRPGTPSSAEDFGSGFDST